MPIPYFRKNTSYRSKTTYTLGSFFGEHIFHTDGWMSSLVIFPLFAGFEFLSLELWNNFEQTGYYRRWGEVNLFIIHAMSFGTPLTRLMRLVLDLLLFFCFGFLLPCCEAWLILLN